MERVSEILGLERTKWSPLGAASRFQHFDCPKEVGATLKPLRVKMMDYFWMQRQVVPDKNPFEHAGADSGQPAQVCRFLMPKVQVPDVRTSLCKCNLWQQSN